MQQATYLTVTRHEFSRPTRPPQVYPVPPNSAAVEYPRRIQQHASQVFQWCQIVNAEDILKQKLLEPLGEKYLKGQRQAYINYANRTMEGIIQNLYDDHGKISPMCIE